MKHLPTVLTILLTASSGLIAQDRHEWTYDAEAMEPFWEGDVVHGESVLFVRPAPDAVATGSLLFPVKRIIRVTNAAGDVIYDAADFAFVPGQRQMTIPVGSKIQCSRPEDLRRPPGTQQFRLTHRDGGDEILFGGRLEYHAMQTSVTYEKADTQWPVKPADFSVQALPRTINRLQKAQPVSIVLLGDSISTGCNASGWAGGAPFQPAWQDLLRLQLQHVSKSEVTLTNLAVGGTSTPWGLTRTADVAAAKPDLVILAFGMNDAAGISPDQYGKNLAEMMAKIRETVPDAEFILVASMLGNRNWTALKHDVFPMYRDQLAALCTSGVALADMTSQWNEILNRKQDHDLTGNGVNHPNDFGHRIYAQVLASLLIE
ncbi:MAG: SGNH/GDSL hydrolase family protein [Planctomycetaceae bacterium]